MSTDQFRLSQSGLGQVGYNTTRLNRKLARICQTSCKFVICTIWEAYYLPMLMCKHKQTTLETLLNLYDIYFPQILTINYECHFFSFSPIVYSLYHAPWRDQNIDVTLNQKHRRNVKGTRSFYLKFFRHFTRSILFIIYTRPRKVSKSYILTIVDYFVLEGYLTMQNICRW